MSEEKALVPLEQKSVDFYGDEIVAVLVEIDDQQQVQVPIRPICDYLGLSWAGQRQRIHRDEILAEVSSECVIHSQGQRRTMLCLPLDYLNGWMFGVNASRVKPEVKVTTCVRVTRTQVSSRFLYDNNSWCYRGQKYQSHERNLEPSSVIVV